MLVEAVAAEAEVEVEEEAVAAEVATQASGRTSSATPLTS